MQTGRTETSSAGLPTVVRVAACLTVVVVHFASAIDGAAPNVLPRSLLQLISDAALSIGAFFFLSGFVMAALSSGADVTLGFAVRFVGRRLLRLAPPYWMAIFATIMLNALVATIRSGDAAPAPSLAAVVANMAFVQGVFHQPKIVMIGWTLAVDVQCYLIFALCLWATSRATPFLGSPRARWLFFAPLAAITLAARGYWPPSTGPTQVLHYWPAFFAGVVTYWTIRKTVSPWAFVLAAMVPAVRMSGGLDIEMLVVAWVAAIFVLSAFGNVLEFRRPHPWLAALSDKSYSLYLVHALVGSRLIRLSPRIFGPHMGWFEVGLTLLGALALTWVATEALWRWVEMPARAASRRLGLTPRRAAALPSAG